MNLGARLEAVAAFVPTHSIVADIGTDHAYLPIELIKRGAAVRALALDIHAGPYEAARRAVMRAGLPDHIEVRQCDGMTGLVPGECDTAVIAGMGGMTMVDILSKHPETTARLRTLVLQPMNAAANLRIWLSEHGWRIADEVLAKEEGRLYEVICAQQGVFAGVEDILYDIGPKIWEKRDRLLAVHIENLIRQSKRILSAMGGSETAKGTEKYQSTKDKIECLEEKLACL